MHPSCCQLPSSLSRTSGSLFCLFGTKRRFDLSNARVGECRHEKQTIRDADNLNTEKGAVQLCQACRRVIEFAKSTLEALE